MEYMKSILLKSIDGTRKRLRLRENFNSFFYHSKWKRVMHDIASIKSDNFTIISSNCIAGMVYQGLNLKYLTPTVGCFFYAPCFLKFVYNLRTYIDMPMEAITETQYLIAEDRRNANNNFYPIGRLGDIEVHFFHYNSFEEAKEKWQRRCERINWNNLYFTFTDRDLCTYEHLLKYDSLSGKKKVCFTAKRYDGIKSVCQISHYKNKAYVGDLVTERHVLDSVFSFKHFIDKLISP